MRPIEIQHKCRMAADAIATLDISSWPSWVMDILEMLQGKAGNPDDFEEDVLRSLRKSIAFRLEEGRW